MVDIIGMGAALVDVLARVDDNFLHIHKLEKGRMHLIDAAQAATIEAQLTGQQIVSGGSAANTCVGYALFGGRAKNKAAFLGRVAEDTLGHAFAGSIEGAGVRYTNLAGTSTMPTGVCYSLITEDGERTMCTFLGASGDFDASAVKPDMLANTKMLYLEGYIWDTVARAEAADAAITSVRAAGGQVGFSLSDGWVVGKHHATFMYYMNKGLVDVLFANEDEILALTERDNFAAAAVHARTLAKTVVLTRSEKGALIIHNGTTTEVPCVPVAKVVDATGAGDLFAAGFLYGYLNGMPMERAGILGASAAADVISHIGARPQMDLKTLLAA